MSETDEQRATAPLRPKQRRRMTRQAAAPVPLAPRRKPLGGVGRFAHVHYDPATGRKR